MRFGGPAKPARPGRPRPWPRGPAAAANDSHPVADRKGPHPARHPRWLKRCSPSSGLRAVEAIEYYAVNRPGATNGSPGKCKVSARMDEPIHLLAIDKAMAKPTK